MHFAQPHDAALAVDGAEHRTPDRAAELAGTERADLVVAAGRAEERQRLRLGDRLKRAERQACGLRERRRLVVSVGDRLGDRRVVGRTSRRRAGVRYS
jgi:hypothetical protein